jgi:DNA modification methylase
MSGKTNRKRKKTATSEFGTRGRVSHDSSKFYESRLYDGLEPGISNTQVQNALPDEFKNHLFCKSSQDMSELPDSCIHLMVTSPPYNARKEYDQDLNLEEYLALLMQVWVETFRVLVPGGRACINIANLGRKPYLPLHGYIIQQMLEVGFLMRGEIIWDKGASASASTAWGSWLSASNPVLRDVHEYILVFSKRAYKRQVGENRNTITREEFLEYTKSVWNFPAVSARKIGHPAPFPEELPYRLIQLYTFAGDIVLDPFVGSGSSCLAAVNSQRIFVGYDTNQEYITLAKQRLEKLDLDSDHG